RIDEYSREINQLLLGEIDAAFAVASLAEVRGDPQYEPSMSWLIDLSLYQFRGNDEVAVRLDEIVRNGIDCHTGNCAIILDRPYEAIIRNRARRRHFESQVRFFVTKVDALDFLGSETVESA
ncbi:MAG: hypothetical protein AAGB46_10530, partial [Verrucomicrobiota bacterium]